jgi:hypothetical protein
MIGAATHLRWSLADAATEISSISKTSVANGGSVPDLGAP